MCLATESSVLYNEYSSETDTTSAPTALVLTPFSTSLVSSTTPASSYSNLIDQPDNDTLEGMIEISFKKNNSIFSLANSFSNQTFDIDNDSIEGLLEISLRNSTLLNEDAISNAVSNFSTTTLSSSTLSYRTVDDSIKDSLNISDTNHISSNPTFKTNIISLPTTKVIRSTFRSTDSKSLSETSNFINLPFKSSTSTQVNPVKPFAFSDNQNESGVMKNLNDSMEVSKSNIFLVNLTAFDTSTKSKSSQISLDDNKSNFKLKNSSSTTLSDILLKNPQPIYEHALNLTFSLTSVPETNETAHNSFADTTKILNKIVMNATKTKTQNSLDIPESASKQIWAASVREKNISSFLINYDKPLSSPHNTHDDSLNELDAAIAKPVAIKENSNKSSLLESLVNDFKLKTNENENKHLALDDENEAVVELFVKNTLKL